MITLSPLTLKIVASIASYMIGAIPFGYFLGKLYGHDITKSGSKSSGATNAFRILKTPFAGIIVVVLDVIKTVVAIKAFHSIFGKKDDVLAGTMATIGHIYSPFISLRGGKGIVCIMTTLTIVSADIFVLTSSLWISSFFLFGISGLSSCIFLVHSATLLMIVAIGDYNSFKLFPLFPAIGLSLVKHIPNIKSIRYALQKLK